MINIKEKIEEFIKVALTELSLKGEIVLEHPGLLEHGDFSSNIAMALAKERKTSPFKLAEEIVSKIKKDDYIKKIEAVPPGFINFYLSNKFFAESLNSILKEAKDFGRSKELVGQKIMIEYTDPNPFKEFHIGHLMSNSIGESISRLIEWGGAEVKRACYQGDVGMHVAKAIFGLLKLGLPSESATLREKVSALGKAYVLGAEEFERNHAEIDAINKKIYEKSDREINELYVKGRAWSLEYFEEIYKKLDTKFNFYFFESESGGIGGEIVRKNIGKIFEESDGAIIFRGENYGLHTRVFINSFGLPTYEAKELGLAKIKYDKYSYDTSIVITGNEVNDYFKVLLQALTLVFPELAKKTRHISHGMLRLPTGKMSSRKGEVVPAEDLFAVLEEAVNKKMGPERFASAEEKKEIAEIVSIGAMKFSILKQSPGRDIIFDIQKAISLEGDSGPYLQYTATRANSVLEKARAAGILPKINEAKSGELERCLYRFPEIIKTARENLSPQYVADYLLDLAQAFNNYYNQVMIIDDSNESPYKVALAAAVAQVITNGLNILGIKVPKKM